MVRGEHDHGGVEQAAAFEVLHQDAHLVVDLLDQAHIGRDDFFARLVARHVAGIAHVHIGGEHRMRVGAFLLRADRRLHVLRPVHAGVGLRRDIGPMRLDVGQMQAPWPAVIFRFRNELHRAPRHVGRLGMLVRHACGLVGVHQQPAVLQSPVLGRAGIGPVLPRIGGVVAVLAQIIVVGRPRPTGRMQAVIALIRLEAAFRHVHADDGVLGDAEILQPLQVGRHMRLADQHVADADLLQVIAERRFANAQWPAVPVRAVRAHVAAGIERHPRRPADRRLHIGVRKQHAAPGHRIDVRRLQHGMPGAAEIIVAKLVAHDPEHVLRRRFGRRHRQVFGWCSEAAEWCDIAAQMTIDRVHDPGGRLPIADR